ncbi:MAG: hypothetical protein F3745_05235 [Nitrospinae bacterium]|nr:hypothetical protein [Nitrospinota bacterium]
MIYKWCQEYDGPFYGGFPDMSKSSVRRIKLQLGLEVDESDLEWEEKQNAPYRYHAFLRHKPTDMVIEQVSEGSIAEAKGYCLKKLRWKIKHWDEWKASGVRESE